MCGSSPPGAARGRDGSTAGWTFSPAPRRIEFHRTKYGRELLADAAFVGEMPSFIQAPAAHVLGFHEILLVTRGRGAVLLDGVAHRVAPGAVLFSVPGEVREWRLAARLDGACLFFPGEFVAEAFRDPRFLDKLTCFGAARPSAALPLAAAERRAFLDRFAAMRRELATLHADAPEALRALLYQLLVLLNRWYVARHGVPAAAPPGDLVERFRRLVERDFARRHRVADYAAELGVSPGHLNARCGARARASAGALIRARVALEARRLLLYSDRTAAQVAEALGFDDPAYFGRFFRREVGVAPARFRAARSPSAYPGALSRKP
jgi:AraC-like DNA-binding protein